jgi:uncharacterized protein YjbI with pentapeptide repeats
MSLPCNAFQSEERAGFIEGKTFTIKELMDILKESKNITFHKCIFLQTPAKFTETGFNDDLLIIRSNVKFIRFMFCEFSKMRIRVDNSNTEIDFTECKTEDLLLDAGKVFEASNTKFSRINFSKVKTSDTTSIIIRSCTVDYLTIGRCSVQQFELEDSHLTDVRLDGSRFTADLVRKTSDVFDEYVYRFFNSASLYDSMSLTTLGSVDSEPLPTKTTDAYLNYRFNGIQLIGNTIETMTISNCHFIEKENCVTPIYNCKLSNLFISNTQFGSIDLYNSTISNNFIFQNSSLKGINLFKCDLPASNLSGLFFENLLGSKLYVFDPTNVEQFSETVKSSLGGDSILLVDHTNEANRSAEHDQDTVLLHDLKLYKGANEEQIADTYLFAELVNNYSKLYRIYKDRGDLRSSNLCYAEMKDLLTRQMKLQYHTIPTFNNYFRWQLANLVKAYTNHGTDPALAVAISLWVIAVFAVLYFFYPSDWDINSKSQLVANYQTFIQKNDKGYFKPFMILVGGIILSFVNALTLSLNAYTTLGFGNIPTRGLARYACVIEGFIGWFMLSIFTVALINQILS